MVNIDRVVKMKEKNGYTIPELVVVIVIVGLIAIFGIMKVSYAFEEINNPEKETLETNHLVKIASEAYARVKKDEFKKAEPSYIFAKEVSEAGFLTSKENFNNLKVKITYDSESNSFTAEVIE